jgi:hypothetical protein
MCKLTRPSLTRDGQTKPPHRRGVSYVSTRRRRDQTTTFRWFAAVPMLPKRSCTAIRPST